MASDEISSVHFRMTQNFGPPQGGVESEPAASLHHRQLAAGGAESGREEDTKPRTGDRQLEYPDPRPALPRPPIPIRELPELDVSGARDSQVPVLGEEAEGSDVPSHATGDTPPREPLAARLDSDAVGALVRSGGTEAEEEPSIASEDESSTPRLRPELAGSVMEIAV